MPEDWQTIVKRRDLFHFLRINNYQIILLQETHFTKNLEHVINTQWGNKCWYSHGTNLAKGVAIVFVKSLEYSVHNVIIDTNGRYLLLYCTIEGKKILLSNVYAPNVDDEIFFHSWSVEVKRFTPEFYILGGDFNLVMDLEIDKKGGVPHTHKRSQSKIKANLDAIE